MRAVYVALLVLLGLFAVSVLAVDTEISLQSTATELTPELNAHIGAVHEAVSEAELALEDDAAADELYDADGEETMFLEMDMELEGDAEAETETETEGDVEMEESLGLDADSEDEALFMELNSDADSDAEADVEVDADTEADSEAGSVTVHEAEADHEQDADPIVTQQMEAEQAATDFGLVEADSEADAETEADAEADADAESEVDAESELEAEAGKEEQTAITKCGKKITWERNQEPNPEVAAAAAASA